MTFLVQGIEFNLKELQLNLTETETFWYAKENTPLCTNSSNEDDRSRRVFRTVKH